MTPSEQTREKEPSTGLEKNNSERRRLITWICFSVAGILAAVLLLYVFVWSYPVQQPVPIKTVTATVTTTPKPTQTAEQSTEPEPTFKPMVMQESFEQLYVLNSDIVGWIRLKETPIDYPVMQTDNNEDYMSRDFNKEYHKAGSLFYDFRCDYTNMFEASHHIIYGHNMKNGSMFQALTSYEDALFFEENRYISLNTLYGNYTFEVFSAYETPISFYYLETVFPNRDAWYEFIKVLEEKSLHESGVKLSGDDVILTLSTCTNKHIDELRFVVHARLLNPELYDTQYSVIY